ncbi:hypothetical protein HPP92_014797 [Vanilla planifolia]|uniref:C2 NT-type domain-containing protein n=1 Tax=Vanilla planifolia TaxID=51239 RepID=A0A835QGP0_VANPL|nr:hypothetical protein HPP92_014797 [Vanilla planifolia]
MLKVTRWKGEKNKIRVVFKLQFHASQVNSLGWEIMMVSLVPLDVGKATMKTDKVLVIGGHCHWRNPIYETVKLFQDSNTGKMEDKLYKFVVSANGIAAAATVGEITVNLADYFESAKPTSASLPLKPSKSGIILHVTIQRMHADLEVRRSEEVKDTILTEQWTDGTHESDICKEERGTKALRNDDNIENGSPGSTTTKNKLTSKRNSTVSTESSTKPKKIVPRENESARKNAIDDSVTSSSLTKGNVNLPKEKQY